MDLCPHNKPVDGYCEFCDVQRSRNQRYNRQTQLEAFVFDLYEGPQMPIPSTQPMLGRADDIESYNIESYNIEENVFNIEQGRECDGHSPPCPTNCIDVGGRCVTVTNWTKSMGIDPESIPHRSYVHRDSGLAHRDSGLDTQMEYDREYIDEYMPSSIPRFSSGSRVEDWRDYTVESPIRYNKQYVDEFIPSTPAVYKHYGN